MHQIKLTNYAAYIKEKAGLELIEWENAWASYTINGDSCFIADIWVAPVFRMKGLGRELADCVVHIAKRHDCTKLRSTIIVHSNGVEDTLKAQIAYGFKVIASDSEKIYLMKEI